MRILLSTLLSLSFFAAFSQYLDLREFGRYDSIKVEAFGEQYRFPWAGGLNTPQFSSIDLNGDTHKDLMIFDRDGQVVKTFINKGTSGKVDFDYAPNYESAYPLMKDYALMYDYDQDGNADIFTSYNGDFTVYKNISTTKKSEDHKFKLLYFKSPFDTNKYIDFLSHKYYLSTSKYIYTNVFNTNLDIPGLVDVDDDGDMDILAFGNQSNSINYYQNMSQEFYGVPDSLDFRSITGCWGHFAEDNASFKLHFGACKSGSNSINNDNRITKPRSGSRHTGSTILINDFDGNGLKDLILGDVSYNSLLLARNYGTKSDTKFTAQDTSFPRSDKPVDVQTFPAAFYFDADNDGIKDLVSAPNATDLFSNINQVHLYKNVGRNDSINPKFQGNDFLVSDMIDLGTDAHPLLIDVDNDSLVDILVGNKGVFSSLNIYESRIAYYRNKGTKTNPSFELVTRDYLTLPNSVDTGLYPTAGDLDNDGDIDLILGTEKGFIHYYENQAASPSDSSVFVLKTTAFSGKVFGKSLRPTLFDVNKDGKLDIVMGNQTPELDYFENTGTANSPNFSPSTVVNGFAGFYSKDIWGTGNLSPFMVSLDTSGKYSSTGKEYLFVGTATGYLYVVSDIDQTSRTQSTVVDSFYIYARNVSISGSDITGDNKMDIMFGHKTGGLSVLLKDGGNIIVQPPKKDTTDTNYVTIPPNHSNSINLFPNPVNSAFTITGLETSKKLQTLTIYNLSGEIALTTQVNNNSEVSVSELSSGIYIVQVETPTGKRMLKLVKH